MHQCKDDSEARTFRLNLKSASSCAFCPRRRPISDSRARVFSSASLYIEGLCSANFIDKLSELVQGLCYFPQRVEIFRANTISGPWKKLSTLTSNAAWRGPAPYSVVETLRSRLGKLQQLLCIGFKFVIGAQFRCSPRKIIGAQLLRKHRNNRSAAPGSGIYEAVVLL